MTDQRRPLFLLVNPVAGGKPGSGEAASNDAASYRPAALASALGERGLNVTLHELTATDEPANLAADAIAAGHDVVVAGGDGTVGPVATALVGTDFALGIIATGSYNNVARGCGVPIELEPALDVIARGATAMIDTGLAWHPGPGDPPDAEAPRDAAIFLEAAGVGLDAAGFGLAAVGARRGPLVAIRTAWRALRGRHRPIELAVDGRTFRTSSPAVTVCNGPYHGMGFALAPDADPADGQLDVVVFAGMTRFQVLGHFLAVARRRPRHEPRVRLLRAVRARVTGRRGALPAHVDGRPFGFTPIAFAVHPASLRLYR